MKLLDNDRYLKALLRQPVDYTPVWMMRQAGRHLPEYRELRKSAGDFMTLCTTPELACEATLQPTRRYNVDAAILFSDILTIPDAMGLGLYFEQGEGPKFKHVLNSTADIAKLPIPDPTQQLAYVMETVRLVQKNLQHRIPLIGFAGSPWTIATYMIEGGSSKAFTKIKKMLYSDPQTLHLLLDKLADSIILYLNAQIEAGVQAVMIFDSWGGILTTSAYKTFSLHYMHKIVDGLKRQHADRYVPITLFTKGGMLWLEEIAKSGCDAIGLDWGIDMGDARLRVGDKVALQGNLDPSVLYGSQSCIHQEVEHILTSFGQGSGHIFNLGHGIHQDVPYENTNYFVETVHQLSRHFHLKS